MESIQSSNSKANILVELQPELLSPGMYKSALNYQLQTDKNHRAKAISFS